MPDDLVPIDDFEVFAQTAEPRLRRAFLGTLGIDRMPDAVAEALGYGWEHWDEVRVLANPIGYLYRVGQSRTRPRKKPLLPLLASANIPEFEPELPVAMMALPETQRTAVWLAHGCRWTHAEIADVLDVSTSTVSTHVNRALTRLRSELGVTADVDS